jgi:hypothetical protein
MGTLPLPPSDAPQVQASPQTPGRTVTQVRPPWGPRSWGRVPRASHLLVFLLPGRETTGHGAELEVGSGQLMKEMHPGRGPVARGRPHCPGEGQLGGPGREPRSLSWERAAQGLRGSGELESVGRGAEIGEGEARPRAWCCPWRPSWALQRRLWAWRPALTEASTCGPCRGHFSL